MVTFCLSMIYFIISMSLYRVDISLNLGCVMKDKGKSRWSLITSIYLTVCKELTAFDMVIYRLARKYDGGTQFANNQFAISRIDGVGPAP